MKSEAANDAYFNGIIDRDIHLLRLKIAYMTALNSLLAILNEGDVKAAGLAVKIFHVNRDDYVAEVRARCGPGIALEAFVGKLRTDGDHVLKRLDRLLSIATDAAIKNEN